MGKPSAPKPVDPNVAASAQTQSNEATARLQSQLNNVNTYGPEGSVVYNQTSPDHWSQTTTLSAPEQQTYDLSKQAQNAALGVANQQVGRVGNALGQPLDTGQFPHLEYYGIEPNLRGTGDAGSPSLSASAPHLQSTFNQGQNIQGSVPQYGAQSQIAGAGPIQSTVSNPQAQSSFNQGPGLQTSISNPQAHTGFDQGQSIQGHLGDSGPIQGQLAGSSPIQTSFNQGPGVQGSVAQGNPLQSSFQNTNVQQQVGPHDFNQAVSGVQDAYLQQALSRLDPTYGKMQSDLQTRLANQGIGINSAAYGNAHDILGRQMNDAYNQAVFGAIGQGAQEQNTLFGQSLAQGQFANQAAGQQFGQNEAQAQFGNEANLNQFNKALQAGQFANQAAGQQYQQNLGAGQFANAAAGQQFQQNLGAGQFANAAEQQRYEQNLGAGQFANQAAGQQYQQALGALNAYNAGTAQNFGQGLAQGQFNNAAAGQQYQQNLGSAQFANAAAGQNFGQNVTAAQLGNSAQQQQFGQNAAQQQAYNAAQQQLFGQGLQAGQFGNAAAQQQYAQNQGAAQFANDTANQGYQNLISGTGAENAALQQGFNNQLANSQLNNQTRQQAIQEQAYSQNLPINQLSSLLGLGQVGQPQGIPYSPTAVQPTDVLGAYALNAQQQQAAYQAKMGGFSGLLGGLSSLGSAAIMMSDRRLKTDIGPAGSWNGIPLYYYRYLWDRILRLGVMAQDVLKVKPEAVLTMPNGYYAVDYGRL